MKKLIFLGAIFTTLILSGCQKTEKETKEAVLRNLKDPDSAKFQNVKGYCGEVNAKNSYGGYTGFSRFVVENGIATIENTDNAKLFKYKWLGSCSGLQVKAGTDISVCASVGSLSEAMLTLRYAGGPLYQAKDIANKGEKSAIEPTLKVIDAAYKLSLAGDKDSVISQFGVNMFNKCASNEIDFGQSKT